MSYRNDHEAAVARIVALEHRLAEIHDQAREKAAHDRERIAMLERELADLRRHAPERSRPPRYPWDEATPPREADTRAPRPQPEPRDVKPIDELDVKQIDERSMQGPPVTVSMIAMVVLSAVAIVALVYATL